jgi:ribosome biogenesis GTPase A
VYRGVDYPEIAGYATPLWGLLSQRLQPHGIQFSFDLEKAALLLLGDYRSGALGRISLETPQSRAQMLAAAVEAAAEQGEDDHPG